MPLSHRDYTVGCICPMGVELAPVKAMLDVIHSSLPTQRDQNSYTLGEICGHNMVIGVLPEIGTSSAATVAVQLLNDFPSIRFGLLVGIGGGVPSEEEEGEDIRLGDVVVSKPTGSFGGVVQYDLSKFSTGGGFERTGVLAKPPPLLRSSVESLAADHRMKGSQVPQLLSAMLQRYPVMKEEYSHPGIGADQLFQADYPHPGGRNCRSCDRQRVVERDDRRTTTPKFHYGIIGSANTVVKDAGLREELRRALKIMCVEMEAAGLMDSFPCLVIRGICDYADSHKNKKWQPYAAATAAAYMKELLSVIPPKDVAQVSPATDVVQIPTYKRGVNLFDAPDMADSLFIGRHAEIQQMEKILLPDSVSLRRRVLVLGGMGGIGKTQLSIVYAKQHGNTYSSVFWLNASSEISLKSSFRNVARRILTLDTVNQLDDDHLWARVSNWLCELDNSRWLLIYDNYDDPEEYDILKYTPSVAHGSIIVTTRIPSRVNGSKVNLRSLSNEEDSLRILSTRSERESIELDPDARELVRRLDGHPLALATAGAYLKESSFSFSKYLQQYEAHWEAVASIEDLPDYPTRKLYTTWDISVTRIRQQNVLGAHLLRFLAYLDNRDIWYDLFREYQGINDNQGVDTPVWFTQLTHSEASFESAMRILVRYCLVEAHHLVGSYSVHVCVHDWTLNGLNREIDTDQYWLAFDCVAGHIGHEDWDSLSSIRYQRIAAHADRFVQGRFQEVAEWQDSVQTRLAQIHLLAELLRQQVRNNVAEQMYLRALAGYERALGPDHTSTLDTVNNLGNLYRDQGKLAEAGKMYLRALVGKEKALGPDHTSTLSTINNLGNLYCNQGKLAEAEKMYLRALTGKEKALGPDHTSTLDTVNNLGLLYCNQGKLAEAEKIYLRALAGREKALGPDHTSTLDTVSNLGLLYCNQGKLAEAEKMYSRALAGYEKALGPDHTSTLDTVNNLGNLYCDQDKPAEAETMYLRALVGKEKALGPDHTSTLDTVNDLGNLYRDQGKLAEAEKMYLRALAGYEKALGPDHTSTLTTVNNLGNLYRDQGKLAEAETMYLRALVGKEKALGSDHTSTLSIVNNLGNLYRDQGKLAEAEKMYLRALTGKEKALGPDHTSTLTTVNNLGNLYRDQGKLAEAEKMHLRALTGREKALGPDHTSTIIVVINIGSLFCYQGMLDKAEGMYQRALTGMAKTSGNQHTMTLGTMNNLGNLHCEKHHPDVAEEMYQQALSGLEKEHGPDHVSVLGVVNNIGVLFADLGKQMESEQMYRRALDGFQRSCGAEHPNTVMVNRNLTQLSLRADNSQATGDDGIEKQYRRRWYF